MTWKMIAPLADKDNKDTYLIRTQMYKRVSYWEEQMSISDKDRKITLRYWTGCNNLLANLENIKLGLMAKIK